jgi:hypothetical protein
MPQFITPFSGARRNAVEMQTDLANAVAHLFKFGLSPSVSTLKSELEANECDFTDYTTKVIASWTGPTLAPVSGYQLNGGLLQWIVVTPTVTNNVGGAWIEDAAGNVIQIIQFDDPGIPMTVVDDQVTIPPVQFFPTSSVAG